MSLHNDIKKRDRAKRASTFDFENEALPVFSLTAHWANVYRLWQENTSYRFTTQVKALNLRTRSSSGCLTYFLFFCRIFWFFDYEEEIRSVIFIWYWDRLLWCRTVKTEISKSGQPVKNLIREKGMLAAWRPAGAAVTHAQAMQGYPLSSRSSVVIKEHLVTMATVPFQYLWATGYLTASQAHSWLPCALKHLMKTSSCFVCCRGGIFLFPVILGLLFF